MKGVAPARRRESMPIRFDLGERPAGAEMGVSGRAALVARFAAVGSDDGASEALRFRPATGVVRTGVLTKSKTFDLGL